MLGCFRLQARAWGITRLSSASSNSLTRPQLQTVFQIHQIGRTHATIGTMHLLLSEATVQQVGGSKRGGGEGAHGEKGNGPQTACEEKPRNLYET